ncbi:MAG: hypothetical protein ACI4DZ_09640 [Oliverpabstia sp.]
MSEYQRFVSYIYEYQNRTRLQNCGFARVEVRNSRCRLQIHMKLHTMPFTPVFQVYAFIPSDGQHIAVLLGKAAWQQGVVYADFMLPQQQIAQTPYGLKDLGGLYIQTEHGQLFATAWKDILIQPELFTVYTETPQIQAASIPSAPEENAAVQLPGSDSQSLPENPAITAENRTPSEEVQTSSFEADTAPAPENIPMESQTLWQYFQDNYPHIHPFFDDTIHQCVRLSTEDIPKLTKLGIPMENNPFFQHGCHSYQHFLLGKAAESAPSEYVLAVPGMYDPWEQMAASVFGFPHFKPARTESIRYGQFGYWYRLFS